MWAYSPAAGCYTPDGLPFAAPSDSFEVAYNDRLVKGLETPGAARGVPGPEDGFPLSMRSFQTKPADVRDVMDRFFATAFEELCKGLGNTPAEWDVLASRLLTYAAMDEVPVTPTEATMAIRFGIDLATNPVVS